MGKTQRFRLWRGHLAGLVLAIVLVLTLLPSLTEAPSTRGAQTDPSVGLWDRFETSITNNRRFADPYNEVTLNVTYTRPDGTRVDFWGFYDGGTTWKIRYMPDQIGTWRYEATFSDGQPGVSGSFVCVASKLPGMLSADETNPRWFGFKGGGHVLIRGLHVGDRFFAANWPASNRRAFLNWAQDQGYNTLSIASHYLNRDASGRGAGWDTPDLWPLNAAEYGEVEVILDDLANRRIMVYPFAGFFGRSADYPSDPEDQSRYIRYTLARLGPYWNILLNVAGPEPNADGYLGDDDVARLGTEIRSQDIFGHPLSVHNSPGDDPYRDSAWSTFGTLQGPKTTDPSTMSSFLLRNHHPSKPLYAHETLWSRNSNQPSYSDADIRKLAYVINMSAVALNFGDMRGNSSSGFSGSMDLAQRDQARHDIVKRVWDFFETVPFYRMTPCPELTSTGACLAEVGREYLVYLDTRRSVDVDVTNGPYKVQWINAQDTSDVRAGGTTNDGRDLAPPSAGDDWLLRLTKENGTVPTPTPTDTPAGTPVPTQTATPPDSPQSGQVVTGFTLLNAETGEEIGPLTDGAILNLATLPTRLLTVRADTEPATVGSVRFGYDGDDWYNLENRPPYMLAGNVRSDLMPWTPSRGSHILAATPYTESEATGTAGTSLTVTFTVVDADPNAPPPSATPPLPPPTDTPMPTSTPLDTDTSAVVGFTLVDADTDRDIGPLPDGITINLAALPTRNLNIRAATNPSVVGSVAFEYDQVAVYSIENSEPYAFAGETRGDYRPWTPGIGPHTLTAAPYSERDATGAVGTPLTVSFTIVDESTTFSADEAVVPPESASFSDGFESGDLGRWTTTQGIDVQSNHVAAGAFGALASSNGTAAYARKQLDAGHSELHVRVAFNVINRSDSVHLLWLRSTAGDALYGLYVNRDGTLGGHNYVTHTTTTSSAPISVGTWYTVEVYAGIAGMESVTTVWLDGVAISELATRTDLGTVAIGQIQIGDTGAGRSYQIAFDEVAVGAACLGACPAVEIGNEEVETGGRSADSGAAPPTPSPGPQATPPPTAQPTPVEPVEPTSTPAPMPTATPTPEPTMTPAPADGPSPESPTPETAEGASESP